ncbi:glycine-rich protein [Aurantibacillus circumpalustris]|uniref:glycine-rich protein n=1 Tax=Aurantibacillus circumpalustris TaxID=3036359 RepID=UPI00295BB410|nr:glycine-rich protein [Aurantibacillus circumpalustris]
MKTKIYKLVSSAKQGLYALTLLVSGTAYSQNTFTFTYSGNQQTMAIPAGPYQIEVWGASGGLGNINSGSVPNSQIAGGVGGYSSGTITVNAPTTWYINVGGKGSDGFLNTTAPGGYNGGGDGSVNSTHRGGGGGGATHVASATGILSSLSGNQSAVVIVGGAGAGGGNQSIGGDGGGLNGIQPPNTTQFSNRTAGAGGSQSAGGACYSGGSGAGFGQGGTSTQNLAGGGGGGWYGGCTGENSTGGGGGSGYIGGVSNGTTAAFGQPGFVPNPDVSGNGLVIITKLCDVTIGASSNPVCQGSSVTLTTSAVTTLSWSASVSTASSIVVTPTSNTTYYVTGIGSNNNCVTTVAINLSMTPLPNISSMVNPPLLCVGNSATLTGQGANTYTWSNLTSGLTTAVSPSVTTTYTASGTDGFGCVNSNTVSVVVNSNSISVPAATTICRGSLVNLTASGAVSYIWSNGIPLSGILVSPTVSTVYSVIGIDVNNCSLSNAVSITVNDLPNVFPSTDKDIICKKESVVLSATGANTYAWSNPITGSSTGASVTLTLNIDVPYLFTVVGTGSNGCSKTATVSVDVQKCAGVNELSEQNTFVSVYPNPNNGLFTVESKQISSGTIEIMDLSGKIIFTETVRGNTTQVNMGDYAAGIYFVKVKNETSFEVIKLIKNQ